MRRETVPGIRITERALESGCLQHTRLASPAMTTSHTLCTSCSSLLRGGMAGYGTCPVNGEECACLDKFSSPATSNTRSPLRYTPPHTLYTSCSSHLRLGMARYETGIANAEGFACLGRFLNQAGLDTEAEAATPNPTTTTSSTYCQNNCLHLSESIGNVQKPSRSREGTVKTGDAAKCSKSATTQVQFQTLTRQTHIPNHCLPMLVMGKVFMKVPLPERSL